LITCRIGKEYERKQRKLTRDTEYNNIRAGHAEFITLLIVGFYILLSSLNIYIESV
jgi:hypothetical protein